MCIVLNKSASLRLQIVQLFVANCNTINYFAITNTSYLTSNIISVYIVLQPCFIHSSRSIRTIRIEIPLISSPSLNIMSRQLDKFKIGNDTKSRILIPYFREAFAFIYNHEALRIQTLFESFHGETHSDCTHATTYYRSLNFLKCIEWIQRVYFNRLTFTT